MCCNSWGHKELDTTEGLNLTESNIRASLIAQVVKNLPANVEDTRDASLIPGSGRPPGEGNGNPLQYSCLENPEEPGRLQSMGLQKVGDDCVTSLSLSLTQWT